MKDKQLKLNLIKRLDIISKEIIRRSNNDKLSKYNTGKVVHKKQMEFHKSQFKNRWVFGGNRSGKTECGAVETVWLATGTHPYKTNKKNISCWVVSLSSQVQRDVAQSKILYYLNPDLIVDIVMSQGKKEAPYLGIIDTIIVKNAMGGTSKIGFKSCDQGREKFQGTSLDFVWFDEEPPYDIYLECKMRVIDRCGQIFGTMTPLKGLTWVYNEIYLNEHKDKEVWCEFMSWEDNPYLNKKEIESISSTLNNDELNSRKYGRFSSFGGMVYNEFDENIHVIDPFEVPLEWQDTMSIDPGLNNPLSCHWYACDYDGNVYVVAEHYEAKRDIQYHSKKIIEKCKMLNWKQNSSGKYNALIDSAANQRTLNGTKSVAELFYDLGISVNTKVNKDLFSGIQRVKSYLKNAEGQPRLFIFKNCPNMIREIKGYFWSDNDVPVKKDDHSLDELRYYIQNRPDIPIKKVEKTLVQKDKDRLIKKLKCGRYATR